MRLIECTLATRSGRLAKAVGFLEAAEALATLGDQSSDAIATAYVHAGIAAADVICCRKLGHHASGQNHSEARQLLKQAEPSLESALGTLLAMKTDAGYGFEPLSGQKLLAAGRAARKLVEAARAS